MGKSLTTGIWTLPTSSGQSFAFAPVVSAVAFVYPACCGLFRPGQSVVRAAGGKHSIDHEDHDCYRPCSAAGLVCFDSVGLLAQRHWCESVHVTGYWMLRTNYQCLVSILSARKNPRNLLVAVNARMKACQSCA